LLELVKEIASFFTVCGLFNQYPALRLSLLMSIFSTSVAGHTMQQPTDGEEEEDGKDECNMIPFSLPFLDPE
jgi:hypothetical protein